MAAAAYPLPTSPEALAELSRRADLVETDAVGYRFPTKFGAGRKFLSPEIWNAIKKCPETELIYAKWLFLIDKGDLAKFMEVFYLHRPSGYVSAELKKLKVGQQKIFFERCRSSLNSIYSQIIGLSFDATCRRLEAARQGADPLLTTMCVVYTSLLDIIFFGRLIKMASLAKLPEEPVVNFIRSYLANFGIKVKTG